MRLTTICLLLTGCLSAAYSQPPFGEPSKELKEFNERKKGTIFEGIEVRPGDPISELPTAREQRNIARASEIPSAGVSLRNLIFKFDLAEELALSERQIAQVDEIPSLEPAHIKHAIVLRMSNVFVHDKSWCQRAAPRH